MSLLAVRFTMWKKRRQFYAVIHRQSDYECVVKNHYAGLLRNNARCVVQKLFICICIGLVILIGVGIYVVVTLVNKYGGSSSSSDNGGGGKQSAALIVETTTTTTTTQAPVRVSPPVPSHLLAVDADHLLQAASSTARPPLSGVMKSAMLNDLAGEVVTTTMNVMRRIAAVNASSEALASGPFQTTPVPSTTLGVTLKTTATNRTVSG